MPDRRARQPQWLTHRLSPNIPCVGTPPARAQATIQFAKYPGTSWEVPDDDGMWFGSASSADHVRRAGGGVRAGVDRAGVAARSGAVPTVATRRRDRARSWWLGGDRGGGLHRLALRRRGGRRRGLRSAPGGAGRYAGGAWSQAARQDRSHRQSVVARVVGRWSVAGVVDPADGGVGVARAGAALQVVGRSAFDVGAADPCRAVSARGDAAGELDPLGGHPRVARRRSTRGERGGSTADPHGVSDDRRASRSSRGR